MQKSVGYNKNNLLYFFLTVPGRSDTPKRSEPENESPKPQPEPMVTNEEPMTQAVIRMPLTVQNQVPLRPLIGQGMTYIHILPKIHLNHICMHDYIVNIMMYDILYIEKASIVIR